MSNEAKTGVEVFTEVEGLTLKLDSLPSIINLVIESTGLNITEPSAVQKRMYTESRGVIYDVLNLVEMTIREVNEGISSIKLKK